MSDPAAGRFAIIALVRLCGALLVMSGLVTAMKATGSAPFAGYAAIALGLAATFVGPRLLARRWRTPPE